LTHKIGIKDDDDSKVSDSTDSLLAQIACVSLSLGVICHILAAKQKLDKGKNQKAIESRSLVTQHTS
jgi:hypothetical protein